VLNKLEELKMKLVYGVKDRPKFGQMIVFAIQQLLAIMAATIAVPAIVGNGMTASAALFGAGVGTIVYQLLTKFRSPVFLGSSFAFIGSMFAAFAGGVSMSLGYLGLILGAVFAGLVYVVIAIVVKLVGVNWINKLMPAAVIGPTVALIGLSLAGAAINDVFSYGPQDSDGNFIMSGFSWVSLVCALVTLLVVVLCSTYGKKMAKLIPFIIGIGAGYAVALAFTLIGIATENPSLMILDFAPFKALVAEAAASTLKVTFKTSEAITAGIAISTSVSNKGKVSADFAGVVMAGGKVAATVIDSAEQSFTVVEGVITAGEVKGTKNEQGDTYNMPAGPWYKQAQAFANSTVGKTAAEIENLETVSDALAAAGCTMKNTTAGYKTTIIAAVGYAR
jgi:uracil permease